VNVTEIVGVATGIAPSAGVVLATSGGVTHDPAPSHALPPFWKQNVPTAVGGLLGVPAVQTSSVHSMPSIGRSVFWSAAMTPPAPLHWFCLQSPRVCAVVTVPAGALS
jgi:hypothetical protein